MSFTTFSTTIGVSGVFTLSKSSVKASLAFLRLSSGCSSFFSTSSVSLARANKSFKNWMLSISFWRNLSCNSFNFCMSFLNSPDPECLGLPKRSFSIFSISIMVRLRFFSSLIHSSSKRVSLTTKSSMLSPISMETTFSCISSMVLGPSRVHIRLPVLFTGRMLSYTWLSHT